MQLKDTNDSNYIDYANDYIIEDLAGDDEIKQSCCFHIVVNSPVEDDPMDQKVQMDQQEYIDKVFELEEIQR